MAQGRDHKGTNPDKENYPDYIEFIHEFRAPAVQQAERIDQYLTRSIKNATRTKVKRAIEAGNVTINGTPVKPSRKVLPGDSIICKLMKPPPIQLIPEDIPLDIKYEDDKLLVVNKPAGMVTHPGFGNRHGTLVNALLWHLGQRESIDLELDDDEEEEQENDQGRLYSSDAVRPGIVHRLDRDTSGLLVIAKNPETHALLARQFAERTTEKYYYAIIWGTMIDEQGDIIANIGRSPRDRKLFAVVRRGGKHAHTGFEVLETFGYLSLVRIKLHTGRTHQIRVHFSNFKHALLGDIDYGGDKLLYGSNNPYFKRVAERCLKLADRQMLHARSLGFKHPDGKFLSFDAELPVDMLEILELLREYNTQYGDLH